MNKKHKYYIEEDVIFSAGIEAIRKLGQEGNEISFDHEKISQISTDNRNPNQYLAQTFFDDLDKEGEYSEKRLKLKTGGEVILDISKDRKKDYTHITRHPGIKFKLKIGGIKVEFPQFLVYGTDVLKKGILELNHFENPLGDEEIAETIINPKKLKNLDQILEAENENLIFNNQFVNVNGGLYFKIEMPMTSDKEKKRFSVNSEEPNLLLLNPSECGYNYLKFDGGFKPRNIRQQLAMNNLANPNIEKHILAGGSGSGKTVLAYVSAINHILGTEKSRNILGGTKDRIVLFKSNDIIGNKNREQGFLPGTKEEKDLPFMKSYIDAHNLCGLENIKFINLLEGFKKGENKLGELYFPLRHPAIEIENLIYSRGRTFENCVVLVDEAQNYTPFEMKNLIERVGIGSVIYLIGDPAQIDNPALSPDYNGFVYAANIDLKEGHPRMSMIELNKNYRSQSAEIMRRQRAPND